MFLMKLKNQFLLLLKVVFSINPAQGKGYPSNVACVTKVSDYQRLKMVTPTEILQTLPIAIAQEKQVTHMKNY